MSFDCGNGMPSCEQPYGSLNEEPGESSAGMLIMSATASRDHNGIVQPIMAVLQKPGFGTIAGGRSEP